MAFSALKSDCEAAMSKLSSLNNEELHDIINEDGKIDEILINMNQSYLQNIESEKSVLLESNSEIAESNLTREPELVEGRDKIEQLSVEGEELTKLVEEKYKELKDKSGDMSLETTLALLQTAASEMEEESENMAQKFLDGETELDEFLDQFLVKRKIMHLRLVKADKLSKILSRDPVFNNVPNYINAPPVTINSNYFPGVPTANPLSNTVPYPTGPLNMPMPGMRYFEFH